MSHPCGIFQVLLRLNEAESKVQWLSGCGLGPCPVRRCTDRLPSGDPTPSATYCWGPGTWGRTPGQSRESSQSGWEACDGPAFSVKKRRYPRPLANQGLPALQPPEPRTAGEDTWVLLCPRPARAPCVVLVLPTPARPGRAESTLGCTCKDRGSHPRRCADPTAGPAQGPTGRTNPCAGSGPCPACWAELTAHAGQGDALGARPSWSSSKRSPRTPTFQCQGHRQVLNGHRPRTGPWAVCRSSPRSRSHLSICKGNRQNCQESLGPSGQGSAARSQGRRPAQASESLAPYNSNRRQDSRVDETGADSQATPEGAGGRPGSSPPDSTLLPHPRKNRWGYA